jgi:SAM-dependent methyltransferase
MLPKTTHDEMAQQLFVRDLKGYLKSDLDSHRKEMAEALDSRDRLQSNQVNPDKIRDELFAIDSFRASFSLQRASQEMLWDCVGESIDRQIDTLKSLAVIDQPKGSLTLNPALQTPEYIEHCDTHLMPGGFCADEGEGDVRQGALMDRAGAVYMMGRNGKNGGLMNDGRGHSVISHLYQFFPDVSPKRVLELGCGVGNTAVGVAKYFPDAEFFACDLGPSVLRYAHARAERLGAAIHFHQANAEKTDFEDASFDLIYTTVVFHEVSGPAIENIIAEAHRLLKPGGVLINLDVAGRYDDLTTWQKISGNIDENFNNEVGWTASVTADYDALYRNAGFQEVRVGYQPPLAKAERGQALFHATGYSGVGGSWYISSGRKA